MEHQGPRVLVIAKSSPNDLHKYRYIVIIYDIYIYIHKYILLYIYIYIHHIPSNHKLTQLLSAFSTKAFQFRRPQVALPDFESWCPEDLQEPGTIWDHRDTRISNGKNIGKTWKTSEKSRKTWESAGIWRNSLVNIQKTMENHH